MIFFLDMDGVICTPRAATSFHRSYGPYHGIDPICVGLLNKWLKQSSRIEETNIVMSSAWRMGQTRVGMEQLLGSMGINGFLHAHWATDNQNGCDRGIVIQEWLDMHPEETKWVIIDDCTDFFDFQKERQILTHLYDGITMDVYIKGKELIEDILNA